MDRCADHLADRGQIVVVEGARLSTQMDPDGVGDELCPLKGSSRTFSPTDPTVDGVISRTNRQAARCAGSG